MRLIPRLNQRCLKKDITLYAKWTQIFYTVTFFVDGVFYKAVDAAHGDKATPPTDIASKADHDFDGWYTATDYAAKWNFDSPVIADITLYARWKPITYTVTFNLNGATGTAPVHPAVLYGEKITKPSAPQRTGCTFDGWYRNAAGTGAAWDFDTDTVTENIILYAKWAVWLLSKDSVWTVTNGSAVSIISDFEETRESEYISYTDETHYTYKESYQSGGTSGTIYEIERSRNGESSHEVEIRRETNGKVDTYVYDRVYDADSGLIKQETVTKTVTSSSGVTGTPSVTENSWTIILQNTAADGTKTYKISYSWLNNNYSIYTIKDSVTLSDVYYRADGSLLHTKTYTFPDNPVIRERLPALTLCNYTSLGTPSNSSYETCELLASTDTTLTVRIKKIYTSTNVLSTQTDYIYTKKALP